MRGSIKLQVVEEHCLQTTVEEEHWKWHRRFGHLNFKSLSQLHEKKMVHGLPAVKVPVEVCESCCKSKQPRNSFKSEVPSRAEKKLEVIFSDVCGPFEVCSLGGNKYFVTFIDEYTRMSWVYLIDHHRDMGLHA